MEKDKVVEYYDYTVPFYKLLWHNGTNALHYGFWDDGTKTHTEALVNTVRTMAEIVKPEAGAKILDAGCGVGGSAIWLARQYGADVVGITISPKQQQKAEKYARKERVEGRTEFLVRDYLNTGFPDATFDIVWGLESVCHAKDKHEFLKEAHRVLKPGGKLIVSDGFLRRAPEGKQEKEDYETFLKGFVLDNLATLNNFEQGMKGVGFRNVQMFDKTEAIKKDSEYMHNLSSRWLWLNQLLCSLQIIPELMVDNTKTGIVQKRFFETTGAYAVFYGEK